MERKKYKWPLSWWHALADRRRLSIRDAADDSENWYMYLSPLRAFAAMVALVLVVFFAVLWLVAYTSVLDLIPGSPVGKSRGELIENIMRLDSLEREMNHLMAYSENISLIMEGKTPVIRDVSRVGDSIAIKSRETVLPSAADSLLRKQMEGDGPYSLSEAGVTDRGLALDLVPPVHGVVSARFDPKAGRYGVEVITAGGQQVVAVKDGTVMESLWSPDGGYIIHVQHANNLVSVYRHNSIVHKQVGERVRGGEVIGATAEQEPDDGGEMQQPFGFELWYNGTAVDPQGYIVF